MGEEFRLEDDPPTPIPELHLAAPRRTIYWDAERQVYVCRHPDGDEHAFCSVSGAIEDG